MACNCRNKAVKRYVWDFLASLSAGTVKNPKFHYCSMGCQNPVFHVLTNAPLVALFNPPANCKWDGCPLPVVRQGTGVRLSISISGLCEWESSVFQTRPKNLILEKNASVSKCGVCFFTSHFRLDLLLIP